MHGLSVTAETCCGYYQSIGRHALRCAEARSVWALGLAESGSAVLTHAPTSVRSKVQTRADFPFVCINSLTLSLLYKGEQNAHKHTSYMS
jgi:hypothetical protein